VLCLRSGGGFAGAPAALLTPGDGYCDDVLAGLLLVWLLTGDPIATPLTMTGDDDITKKQNLECPESSANSNKAANCAGLGKALEL